MAMQESIRWNFSTCSKSKGMKQEINKLLEEESNLSAHLNLYKGQSCFRVQENIQ